MVAHGVFASRTFPPVTAPSGGGCLCSGIQSGARLRIRDLRRLGVPAAEVEDLAHDVFVVLHRNWPTLDTERPLRPYLFGVAFRIVSRSSSQEIAREPSRST